MSRIKENSLSTKTIVVECVYEMEDMGTTAVWMTLNYRHTMR